MLNLDEKVNRPSIFYAEDDVQMGGFFKKLKKKLKKIALLPLKIAKKSITLPIKVTKKAVKAVGKVSGKTWKIVGGVAAVATAAYFTGGLSLGAVAKEGGKSLAAKAGSSLVKMKVQQAIQKKLSKSQIKLMKAQAAAMTPEQVLASPEFNRLGQEIAEMQIINDNQGNKIGRQLLAKEGAMEIEHQMSKIAGVPTTTIMKIGIPLALGAFAFLL